MDNAISVLLDALRSSIAVKPYINEPVEDQTYTSIFVGLYPATADARRIVETYNLHPSWVNELHVTLIYTLTEYNPEERAVNEEYRERINNLPESISAKLNGITRFAGADGGSDALVLNVDSPAIGYAREVMTKNSPIQLPDDHGFTPHMTIAYLGKDQPTPIDRVPTVLDVTFDRVSVGYRSNYTHYSLGHSGIKELTIDDVNDYLPVTIDDESGEREQLNPKRRRSYNMGHVEEG